MKRSLIIVLLISLMVVGFSLGTAASGHFSPKNIDELFFGVNPLLAIFGVYQGQVGLVFEHTDEINVPFHYIPSILGSGTQIGIGGTYRYYTNHQAKGLFIGGGSELAMGFDSVLYNNFVIFTPTVEAGYRIKFGNLTINPVYKFQYSLSTAGEELSGFDHGLFLEIGYWAFNPESR